MRNVIAFLFVLITLTCSASTFSDGVQEFKKKEFGSAIELFNKEIKSSPNNVSAYFNLGLSYNANKEYGKAIWAFERVLKLTPNNAEAIDNIEQNYTELDNGLKWESDLSRLQRVLYSLSSNTWSYISILFSLLSALLIIILRKTSSISKKRVVLITSVCTLILMAFSIYTASGAYSNETSHEYGIIVNDKVGTFKNGDANNTGLTGVNLDTGTKVKELKKFNDQKVKVETEDGSTHFISLADVQFI